MKVVIGGMLNQEENLELVRQQGIDSEIMDDMSAAMAVKTGQYEYYFGSCQTGAGGALAMPIAILGNGKCISVAGPGFVLSEDKIAEAIAEGKVAFGFVPEAAETVIPVLVDLLSKQVR